MSGFNLPDDVSQSTFDRYWNDKLTDAFESDIDPTPEDER